MDPPGALLLLARGSDSSQNGPRKQHGHKVHCYAKQGNDMECDGAARWRGVSLLSYG